MGDLIPFPLNGGAASEPKRSLYPTMFCGGCGADRTAAPSAADPGPCPTCGSTLRSSCRPGENGYPAGLGFLVTDVGGLVDPVELVSGAGVVSYYFPQSAGGAA